MLFCIDELSVKMNCNDVVHTGWSTITMTTVWNASEVFLEYINLSILEDTISPLEVKKPWPTMKQPALAVAILAVTYLTVAVVGVLSNGLVIGVICIQPRMRTVINYFLANLAMADALVCVLVLPISLLQNIYTGKCSCN